MDMDFERPITHLPVCTPHTMGAHSMVLSLEQDVVAFLGVEVVVESLVVDDGSVAGDTKKEKDNDYFHCEWKRGDWKDHHCR